MPSRHIFPPLNIRAYLSLYPKVVLNMPLADNVESTLGALGVSRRELRELVTRENVVFLAPQSIERYDHAFFAEILEASSRGVLCTRRLASASHLEQLRTNPLLVFPGTSLERRTLLRCLRKVAQDVPAARMFATILSRGLTEAWDYFEWALHVRGGMAPIAGPLAYVGRELARSVTGKDLFIELGAAALRVEWAAALGAHYAPFSSDDYSEVGHAALLLALHSGFQNDALVATPTSFSVAEELLVIGSDIDVIDFVSVLGAGDLSRFRDLVRKVARPGRSPEDVSEEIAQWNAQVRAYERRPDRLKTMGLFGMALGIGKLTGAQDLVSLSTALLPMLPAVTTFLAEEVLGDVRGLSATLDTVNARLAGVHHDAVLLARMKKVVKGMK